MSEALTHKQKNLIWVTRPGIWVQLLLLAFLFLDTILYYLYVLGTLPELLIIIYNPIYQISRYFFPLFHLICLLCAVKWFPQKGKLRKTLLTGYLCSAVLLICNNIFREHLIDYVLTPFVTKNSLLWCFLLALPYVPVIAALLIFGIQIMPKKVQSYQTNAV